MMKQLAKIYFVVWVVVMFTIPTLAHGVYIEYNINEPTGEISVWAGFDSDEVLDNAAVIIFAPDDLQTPWSTGTTDEEGVYTFMPDYSVEGSWDIQIRKAGHGANVSIEITSDMMPENLPETTSETDDTSATLVTTDGESQVVTVEDGSRIVITGDATFEVEGNVIILSSDPAQAQTAAPADSSSGEFSKVQIVIMSLSVIWGFMGTAFFFARRKPKSAK